MCYLTFNLDTKEKYHLLNKRNKSSKINLLHAYLQLHTFFYLNSQNILLIFILTS